MRYWTSTVAAVRAPGGRIRRALSTFGVMFFGDPRAAFANIAAALRPGGRLAFLCSQEPSRCEFFAVPLAAIAAHVPPPQLPGPGDAGPFSLADPQRIRALLGGAGFSVIGIDCVTQPMWIGADVADSVGYYQRMPIAQSLLSAADQQATAAVTQALREALRPHQGADGVTLRSAAWLVTATR
jgi:SAM-dependent methyltransferase